MKTTWIRFYFSDWLADTAHLDMMQEGAYHKLICWMYQHERPLPGNLDKLFRILHAVNATEQATVRGILDEYFMPFEDPEYGPVFRHARVEKELEYANNAKQSYVDRGEKGAAARWGKKPSQWHSQKPSQWHSHRSANANESESESESEREIETETETPSGEDSKGPNGPMSGKPDRARPKSAKKAPTDAEVSAILDHLNHRTGSQFRLKNGDGKRSKNADLVAARLREHGKAALIGVIDRKTAEWGENDRMATFLRPGTLFRREKCEQYVGELTRPLRLSGGTVEQQNRRAMDEFLGRNGNDDNDAIDGEFTREPD